jgi:tetratricopeptide (TPR) repeat protein
VPGASAPERSRGDQLVADGWRDIFTSATADTLSRAEARFREALRQDPNRPNAMLGLAAQHIIAVGNLAVSQPDPYLADADQLIDRLLTRLPNWSPAYYYRGLSLKLRGELRPALAAFEHSAALNPSFAPAYAQIGQVLTSLGNIEEGLGQIRYAISLSQDDPTLANWSIFAAWAELERRNDDAAFALLFRAIALSPDSRLGHGSLAAAYALAGDRLNAEHHARKFKALTEGVSDRRRLELFGAFLPPPSPHRVAEGLRAALEGSN